MIDTLLQFKDLMTGSKDSKISKQKEKLKEQIEKGNSIKSLQDLKSGDLKKLPKSEKQLKNKGKKKLQDAYENNMDDLPRGLKMDTTTNSSGTTRNFSMGGDVTVGKGSDYIKDLID